MDYKLGWGRSHPGHLVYLIDLSGSMKKDNKIGQVMNALQNSLRVLLQRCTQGKALLERFTVTIIGYHSEIVPLFSGGVQEIKSLIMTAVSTGKPLFDYKEGGVAEPKWQTYMSNAFDEARRDIEQWISTFKGKECPAPIVINITDGQPEEDGKDLDLCANETLLAARKLMSVRTSDGNVLLYNLHFGNSGNINEIILPIEMPNSTGDQREDRRIQFLYNSSSVLTEKIARVANSYEIPAHVGSHGMVSNVQDNALLVRLIEFSSGTGMVKDATETPKS